MAITECGHGHLYDNDVYSSCPYCNGGMNVINFNAGPPDRSGVGGTAPVAGGYGPSGGSDMGLSQGGPDKSGLKTSVGKTAPVSGGVGKTAPVGMMEEIGKTEVVGRLKDAKREPVVGWLICIDGPEKGKDYRLYPRQNTIGRDEGMDVAIMEDKAVSREAQARLAFDQRHLAYTLIPAEGTNDIYLNDEPVYVPLKLNPYDCLEFGKSKFLFVPFCGNRFDWEKGLKC